MINFTTFADAKEFYQFWDAQDHTQHTTADFVLRALIVSIFNEETDDQTVARLMRTLPPIHSERKWKNSGRTKYDTLNRFMDELVDTYRDFSTNFFHRAKFYLPGVFTSKLTTTTIPSEQIRIPLAALAAKVKTQTEATESANAGA